jgi:hypothetical protein
MVVVMVVQTKVKMLVMVDPVVEEAQQQIREVILDLQIQIAIQPDKEILVGLEQATEVAAVVVPVKLDMLDLDLQPYQKVVMVFLSQVFPVHTEQRDRIQVDILLVVDPVVNILSLMAIALVALVAVEQEKVMILSAVMELLTPEVVEEVQVVDLLTPLVELVVLVFVSFVIILNSQRISKEGQPSFFY